MVQDTEASSNESGNQTRVYAQDEIVDCKEKWQEDLAMILVDGGLAMEVKAVAPKEKKILKDNKQQIEDQIDSINALINKSEKMIKKLEFDLKRKMNSLGIKLSREQIRVMTTRVDGDDFAKIFAIFDQQKRD